MDDQLKDDEFYIGYAPPMPPRLARHVTRVTLGLGGGIVVWSVIAAAGHVPLEGGTFEFGHPAQVSGTVIEHPYPALKLDDGGKPAPASLLVATGKHGAAGLIKELEGRRVTVSATPISRRPHSMLELEGPPMVADGGSAIVEEAEDTGREIAVRGEIVDSKCFLGVMVPGAGTTHKDCASLCIRGGIPPALFVKDLAGQSALLLLVDEGGNPVNDTAFRLAGTAVEIKGTLLRQHGWLVLRSDPAEWRPAGR